MELYLDQFGSLLLGPDSVGDVVVKLHPSSGTGGRSVSLLRQGKGEMKGRVSFTGSRCSSLGGRGGSGSVWSGGSAVKQSSPARSRSDGSEAVVA